MILRPFRWAASIVVTFAVAWVLFMVPFGRFTLFQHLARIARTDEARELGGEVDDARARLTSEVVRQVGEAARLDGGAQGASAVEASRRILSPR